MSERTKGGGVGRGPPGEERPLPLLKHDDFVRSEVGHVDFRGEFLQLGVLGEAPRGEVAEEEASLEIVPVVGRAEVFVVEPVVEGPVVHRTLKQKKLVFRSGLPSVRAVGRRTRKGARRRSTETGPGRNSARSVNRFPIVLVLAVRLNRGGLAFLPVDLVGNRSAGSAPPLPFRERPRFDRLLYLYNHRSYLTAEGVKGDEEDPERRGGLVGGVGPEPVGAPSHSEHPQRHQCTNCNNHSHQTTNPGILLLRPTLPSSFYEMDLGKGIRRTVSLKLPK